MQVALYRLPRRHAESAFQLAALAAAACFWAIITYAAARALDALLRRS
jgi:hypothetical protein